MNEKNKKLKNVSLIYLVLSFFTLILVGANFLFPSVAEKLMSTKYSDINFGTEPTIALAYIYVFEALVYLWYSWLIRRIIKGKSTGIFLMIILILGIISSFIDQFNSFNVSTLIGIFIDAYTFQLIFMIREENKKDRLL